MRPSRCCARSLRRSSATLLRRGLAELAGLRETEMASAAAGSRAQPRPPPLRTRPQRDGAVAAARALLQCVLLEPDARRIAFDVPEPAAPVPKATRWRRLVAHCRAQRAPLTTAGVMQQFAGSPHGSTSLMAALTAGESEGLAGELLEVQLVEGSSAIG